MLAVAGGILLALLIIAVLSTPNLHSKTPIKRTKKDHLIGAAIFLVVFIAAVALAVSK